MISLKLNIHKHVFYSPVCRHHNVLHVYCGFFLKKFILIHNIKQGNLSNFSFNYNTWPMPDTVLISYNVITYCGQKKISLSLFLCAGTCLSLCLLAVGFLLSAQHSPPVTIHHDYALANTSCSTYLWVQYMLVCASSPSHFNGLMIKLHII